MNRQIIQQVILTAGVIGALIGLSGCGTAPRNEFALDFRAGQKSTYKVVTESKQVLTFEGSLKENDRFKDGRDMDRIEMIYDQTVLSVNEGGIATVRVNIKALKVLTLRRDNPVIEYDSGLPAHAQSPLTKLVGGGYTITIDPRGQVIDVTDLQPIGSILKGSDTESKMAQRIMAPKAIRMRHSMLKLPEAEANQLKPGQQWTDIETFTFPILGTKTYEKIYTMKDSQSIGKHTIATVEMETIPSAEMAEELYAEEGSSMFSEMFDNVTDYSGKLKLDLTTGEVVRYYEQFDSEWVMVDPQAIQTGDEQPDTVRMGAVRYYNLEKIN